MALGRPDTPPRPRLRRNAVGAVAPAVPGPHYGWRPKGWKPPPQAPDPKNFGAAHRDAKRIAPTAVAPGGAAPVVAPDPYAGLPDYARTHLAQLDRNEVAAKRYASDTVLPFVAARGAELQNIMLQSGDAYRAATGAGQASQAASQIAPQQTSGFNSPLSYVTGPAQQQAAVATQGRAQDAAYQANLGTQQAAAGLAGWFDQTAATVARIPTAIQAERDDYIQGVQKVMLQMQSDQDKLALGEKQLAATLRGQSLTYLGRTSGSGSSAAVPSSLVPSGTAPPTGYTAVPSSREGYDRLVPDRSYTTPAQQATADRGVENRTTLSAGQIASSGARGPYASSDGAHSAAPKGWRVAPGADRKWYLVPPKKAAAGPAVKVDAKGFTNTLPKLITRTSVDPTTGVKSSAAIPGAWANAIAQGVNQYHLPADVVLAQVLDATTEDVHIDQAYKALKNAGLGEPQVMAALHKIPSWGAADFALLEKITGRPLSPTGLFKGF